MAVIADHEFRIQAFGAVDGFGHGARRELFKVDLVNDPVARRDDPEVGERLSAPAQKGEPLPVDRNFSFLVETARLRTAVVFDRHRVIDDKVGRQARFDARRVDIPLGKFVP